MMVERLAVQKAERLGNYWADSLVLKMAEKMVDLKAD